MKAKGFMSPGLDEQQSYFAFCPPKEGGHSDHHFPTPILRAAGGPGRLMPTPDGRRVPLAASGHSYTILLGDLSEVHGCQGLRHRHKDRQTQQEEPSHTGPSRRV